MTTNVPLNQETGSGGRGSPITSRPSTSWRQTRLIPPALLQVRLDLGWSADERLGMFSAEAYIPTTKELLALEVHPTRWYPGLENFLETATTWQRLVLGDVFDPDPFE